MEIFSFDKIKKIWKMENSNFDVSLFPQNKIAKNKKRGVENPMRGFVLYRYYFNPSKSDKFLEIPIFRKVKNKSNKSHILAFAAKTLRPQAPWDPSPEQDHVLAVPTVVLTALYDQMAPRLCQFEISNFDVFVDQYKQNTFWHSGIHRAEERKSSFFHLLSVFA